MWPSSSQIKLEEVHIPMIKCRIGKQHYPMTAYFFKDKSHWSHLGKLIRHVQGYITTLNWLINLPQSNIFRSRPKWFGILEAVIQYIWRLLESWITSLFYEIHLTHLVTIPDTKETHLNTLFKKNMKLYLKQPIFGNLCPILPFKSRFIYLLTHCCLVMDIPGFSHSQNVKPSLGWDFLSTTELWGTYIVWSQASPFPWGQ